jgi:4-amino-4-deoxy-L-arabinose transferase-like glycosyltransferase
VVYFSLVNIQKRSKNSTGPAIWVLFFTLVGFWLRVQRLDFQPLWGDEGWSFYFTVQPVSDLLALTAIDIHPPLYYLLLKLWLSVAIVSPEAARFFSVIVGTLLIPAVAVLGRRVFDQRVGGVSAFVVTMMPLAVYYAQEVRMYGLVTLLGVLSTYFYVRGRDGLFFKLGYIICSVAALYTMYFAAFFLVAHLLHALIFCRRDFSRTVALFVAVGILYLPWAVYAGPRLVDYIGNKREVEGYASLGMVQFLWSHLAAFSMGHLWEQLWPWIIIGIAIAISVGVIGLYFAWRSAPARIIILYLAVPLLGGYLVNRIYPFTPPYFERTLLLAAPAFWLLVAAGVIWLWDRQRLLTGLLGTLLLLFSVVNLFIFFVTPRYADEDYRLLLQQVSARATTADTLLASYQWQLGFYHAYLPRPHPRLFVVPGWGAGWSAQAGNAGQRNQDLLVILAESPRLWFPAYQASGHIWEDETEAAIASLGYPALLQWFSPQTKLMLAGAGQSPVQSAPTANFANRVLLTQAEVGGNEFQTGRDIIPIALTWQRLIAPGDGDKTYNVSLRLADAYGHTWSIRDELAYPGASSINTITTTQTLTQQIGFLTPVGAPPGQYQLLISVRHTEDGKPLDVLGNNGQSQGAEQLLSQISLVPPRPPVAAAALPVQNSTDATFNRRIRMVGTSLGNQTVMVGEQLPLTLFWESSVASPDVAAVAVEVENMAGQVVVTEVQPFDWAPTEWQPGDLLRQPFMFTLPPTLPAGQYRLTAAVINTAGNRLPVNGTDRYKLQWFTTVDRPHVFEPPVVQAPVDINFGEQARLVGIDLPRRQGAPGDTLQLTLHWQALATAAKNWKVFLHLTDDQGNIVAQKDQIPGDGKLPLTGWVPGEYLIDDYSLAIPADAPRGTYLLKVGLYDANDGSRLPVLFNDQVVGDHATLESWPILVE